MAKYVDLSATIQVIGCIFQNPSLLDDGKYFFNEEDFTEEFHRILFGSIFNLHSLGAKEITINTIEDYLKERPKSLAVYKNSKGAEYLQKLKQNIQLSTFDYYYQRLKKMTLLRMYSNAGMDLSWLYDVDNILDIKKKQIQEDWLDNNSLEDIAEIIDKRITEIRMKYIDNTDEDFVQAGNKLNELIENLKKHPEFGYPMYGSLINTITRGARLKKFYLRSAATGVGKCLPNSTNIPTPKGYTTVGQVKVGDYLFDAFGKPTKVLAIYPQGKKEVWEVTFKDGRKARCCEEHLWSYCVKGQEVEKRKFHTNTLKELYQQDYKNKILVPMQRAVEYEEKVYYVKPYDFGFIIGWGYKDKKDGLISNFGNLKLTREAYIPNEYLRGSISQRFDLLNGLLDSNGNIDEKDGKVSYCTTSSELKDDIVELARSLGFKTSVEDNSKYYKIVISGRPEDEIKLFKLDRKKELILQWYNNGERKENNLFNPIIEIKKLNYSEEMTCFYVDNEEHLFLMNDYIVTHNTRAMIADACNFACDEIYDTTTKSWVSNGTKEPTMFITTEQEIDEIQTMMLAFLSAVNENHIIYNKYEGDEVERVLHAAKIIKESPLYIKRLPDFSISDIENTIKYGIHEWGVRYICLDYLHTSMKILTEVTSKTGIKGLREDNVLFMLSIRLKDLCNEFGVFILSSTQLNSKKK